MAKHRNSALPFGKSNQKPLVVALEAWLRDQRAKLSAKSETAKAITYCLTR